MNISPLSHISPVRNYSRMKTMNSDTQQQSAINFQGKFVSPKSLLMAAPVALALFAGSQNLKAQKPAAGDSISIDYVMPVQLPDILKSIGKYYEENGFTPEQRQFIADTTEHYVTKHYRDVSDKFDKLYKDCEYFSELGTNNGPVDPIANNLKYMMNDIDRYTESLNKFRHGSRKLGLLGNEGIYTPMETFDPEEENAEAIQQILGDGVDLKQYIKDNEKTIKELMEQSDINISALTPEQKDLVNKLVPIARIIRSSIDTTWSIYDQQAYDGFYTYHMDPYFDDMRKLIGFRYETNPKNQMCCEISDGYITGTFEYSETNKVFPKAAYVAFLQTGDWTNLKGVDAEEFEKQKKSFNQAYDLSGRPVDKTYRGIKVENGKLVLTK